jgi:hypothetical protein
VIQSPLLFVRLAPVLSSARSSPQKLSTGGRVSRETALKSAGSPVDDADVRRFRVMAPWLCAMPHNGLRQAGFGDVRDPGSRADQQGEDIGMPCC